MPNTIYNNTVFFLYVQEYLPFFQQNQQVIMRSGVPVAGAMRSAVFWPGIVMGIIMGIIAGIILQTACTALNNTDHSGGLAS